LEAYWLVAECRHSDTVTVIILMIYSGVYYCFQWGLSPAKVVCYHDIKSHRGCNLHTNYV